MRALNLFSITRITDKELISLYESELSHRDKMLRPNNEEIDLISAIVEGFLALKAESECFEDWFYSFSIPQISKEFDLLKIGHNRKVVNVELKSQHIEDERIIKQLEQNKYYLSHIADEVFSFVFINQCNAKRVLYKYINGRLEQCDFPELIEAIKEVEDVVTDDIESLFKASDFLISPINTPQRFIDGQYFLTNQQDEFKQKIIESIEQNDCVRGITGNAGTGKTLLLYDIAKEIGKKKSVCIVHCGILSAGHCFLNQNKAGFTVIPAKGLDIEVLSKYQIICFDESQRLYVSTFETIKKAHEKGIIKKCIFSYDAKQTLSVAEKKADIPQRLRNMLGFEEIKLTERIRTNKEILSFARNLMRLTDVSQSYVSYDCIDVLYANTQSEADYFLSIYKDNDYKFITFTPSRYIPNSIDHYSRNNNSHEIIGQEFEKVVLILDNNFAYSDEGDLLARVHPNPNYLFVKMFYQNITRAREKLCIIVIGNKDLFKRILEIKQKMRERC